MEELKHLTYGIVGLGIMGGSFAKAIKKRILSAKGSTGKVIVCNRSTACLEEAKKDGVADITFSSKNVQDMLPLTDILFICLYPGATVDFIQKNMPYFKANSIITDISGVKGVFSTLQQGGIRSDVDFIIGHPMAGGEKEGYASSNDAFFLNHNYILCPRPENKAKNISLFKTLVQSLGFSRITETTCQLHDRRIAFTSQLCHVIAAALVDCAEDTEVTAFGGGSFEDLTRIALINAPLWTELFLANKTELAEQITRFEKSLNSLKMYIQNQDASQLEHTLENVRKKRLLMKEAGTKEGL